MDLSSLINLLLHFDKYFGTILDNYGSFSYLFLFIIIFLETGLVFTPFLPGDSLIFLVGAFAAQGYLNILVLFLLIVAAAVIGDTFNYWVGFYLGHKISKSKFVKKEYLERTEAFYKKHGGRTIILARFIPIVRTFAPFVAGIGKMNYSKFFSFNFFGGILWVLLFLFSGFFFGNIQFVKDRLTFFVLLIIVLSIIPAVFEFVRQRMKSKKVSTKQIE